MLTARTVIVDGVDPWAGVTVSHGVGVVALNVTGVVPVDRRCLVPLFWRGVSDREVDARGGGDHRLSEQPWWTP